MLGKRGKEGAPIVFGVPKSLAASAMLAQASNCIRSDRVPIRGCWSVYTVVAPLSIQTLLFLWDDGQLRTRQTCTGADRYSAYAQQ